MKQITLTYIALLFLPFFALSQTNDSVKISGQLVGNTRFAKVVMMRFGVGQFPIVAVPIKNEKFSISAPADIPPGVYRLQYSQNSYTDYVDIIIDGKEKSINFTIDLDDEYQIPVFTYSNENKSWYNYQAQASMQLQKIEVLNILLAQYPSKADKIVAQTEEAVGIEKKKYNQAYKQFVTKHKNTWAGAMVSNSPYYFTNPVDPIVLQDYYRRVHFWDGINTTNAKLINTPLFAEHILNYLQYYMNPDMQFTEPEMEQGFLASIDTIVQKFTGDDETRLFAIKYLALGFKEIGQEKALQYIDETYNSTEQCNDDLEQQALEKRMAGYAAIKPGIPVPEIRFLDTTKKEIGLVDIASEYVVVAFWATWCQHCNQVMSKLNNLAKEQNDVTVLAISLDTDKTIYKNTIAAYDDMLHYCDYQSWESAVAQDYYIYGTPTFFLLDKERKLIEKFSSYELLLNYFVSL